MASEDRFSMNRQSVFLFALFLLSSSVFSQTPASWQALGPVQFPSNYSGQINGIGRVCQLKFHTTNPQKVYAVSASGGLWISTDGTISWQRTGTDALPLTSCSAVCIDFSNDSILYLSTGDPNYYNSSYGIYKSIDAGATWFSSNSGIGNRMAVELIMDPSDNEVLIAATDDGIWKSTDAGLTWIVKKAGGSFTDMHIKPAPGTRTLYAVTFSEFWKSDDFGETWFNITSGISVPGGGSGLGMRLATSAADSNLVYAGMIKDEGTIFKSTDGGNTFQTAYHQPSQSLVGYDASGNGQGNYNFTMCADPGNPNVLFVGAHVVWRSVDGGVQWTKLTNWWQTVHTDMHHMIMNPHNPIELYNANDGGVWRSLNAGLNWSARSNGLEATEVYKAAANPLRQDMISIGTQDNGELYSINGQWRTNRGGDWGSRMTYDYQNFNMVYYHENGKRRNVNGGGEVTVGLPITASNNMRYAFTPADFNIGFAGLNDVYYSSDIGNAVPFWTQASTFNAGIRSMAVSPFNSDKLFVLTTPASFRTGSGFSSGNPNWTSVALPAGVSASGIVSCSEIDSNLIYIAAGSKVYRSDDQGLTWTNKTLNLPNINIIGIYQDPYSLNEGLYVCNTAGIWYKNAQMNFWYNYSQGLPLVAGITDFMVFDGGPQNSYLRVSTYGRGVWQTQLIGSATGLLEASEESNLVVYPNPASVEINIRYDNFKGRNPHGIEIFDETGKIVLRKSLVSLKNYALRMDITSLSTGVYFLCLRDHSGSLIGRRAFLVSR